MRVKPVISDGSKGTYSRVYDTLINRLLITQIVIHCIFPINILVFPVILWWKLLKFSPVLVMESFTCLGRITKQEKKRSQTFNRLLKRNTCDEHILQLETMWMEEYEKRYGRNEREMKPVK